MSIPSSPSDSGTGPVVISSAPDQDFLSALTIDEGHVDYVGGQSRPLDANNTAGSDTSGVVRRADLTGKNVTTLWTGQGYAYAVAITSAGVYFLTYDYATSGRTGILHRVSGTGALDEQMGTWRSQGSCMSVVAHSDNVFWTYSSGTGGSVLTTDPSGVTSALTTAAFPCPGQITVANDRAYWIDSDNVLDYVPTTGGSVVTTWQPGTGISALAAGPSPGGIVYAASGDSIFSVRSDGQALTILPSHGKVSSIAVDAAAIYWASAATGQILCSALNGSSQMVVASGMPRVASLVVGPDERIYWVDVPGRRVFAAPKTCG